MPDRNTGDGVRSSTNTHTPFAALGEGNGHRKRAAARDMNTHAHTHETVMAAMRGSCGASICPGERIFRLCYISG